MSAGWSLRRLGSGILLAAVFAASGGFHQHERLSGFTRPEAASSPNRVVSSHSPLSKVSHWHSVVRAADDTCLACHGKRFAALTPQAHGPAPLDVDRFASHCAPQRTARLNRFSEPSRGPPSVS